MKLAYYALLLKAGLSLPTPQQQQQYNDMQAYQNYLLPALNSIFNEYSANYQENERSGYSLLDINNTKALHQELPSDSNIWFRGSNPNSNTDTNYHTNPSPSNNNSGPNTNTSNAKTNSKPEDKKESPENSQRDLGPQKQTPPVNISSSRPTENKPTETQPNKNISSDKTEKKDSIKKDLTPTTTTTATVATTTTTTATSSSSTPTATSGNAEHKESLDMVPSDEVKDIWTKWI